MIVIEHLQTGERFSYPATNTNKETPTGFIQFQEIPRGFKISDDQTPTPLHYTPDGSTVEVVKWESNSKDPINTMEVNND